MFCQVGLIFLHSNSRITPFSFLFVFSIQISLQSQSMLSVTFWAFLNFWWRFPPPSITACWPSLLNMPDFLDLRQESMTWFFPLCQLHSLGGCWDLGLACPVVFLSNCDKIVLERPSESIILDSLEKLRTHKETLFWYRWYYSSKNGVVAWRKKLGVRCPQYRVREFYIT